MFHERDITNPPIMEKITPVRVVPFQYNPNKNGARQVEAMIAQEKAVSVSTNPGGLRASRMDMRPMITLVSMLKRSSFFSSILIANDFFSISLTIDPEEIIRTEEKVDMPAAMTPIKKIATAKGER